MRKKPKPRPTWTFSNVAGYDFTQLVRSNPPPIDYNTPVIPFGRYVGQSWVMA